MFDIGGAELLVIGIVALIVVGPKDLPGMFRTVGKFTGKARGMAREFSKAMESAADEAGGKDLKEITKFARDAANPRKLGLDKLNQAIGGALDGETATKAAAPALSPDRAEAARKISEAGANAATARRAKEAEAAAAAATSASATAAKAAPKPAAPKPAAPKSEAAPKPAARAAKSPTTKAAKPAVKAAPKSAATPKKSA